MFRHLKVLSIAPLYFSILGIAFPEDNITPPPPEFVNNCKLDSCGIEEGLYNSNLGRVRINSGNNRLKIPGGVVIVDSISFSVSGAIEFPNLAGNYLFINEIIFDNNSWVKFIAPQPGASHLFVRDNGQDMNELIRHTCYEPREGVLLKHYYIRRGEYYQLITEGTPWTPIPEPTTYGAMFSASALGLALACRRKRKRESILFTRLSAKQQEPEAG